MRIDNTGHKSFYGGSANDPEIFKAIDDVARSRGMKWWHIAMIDTRDLKNWKIDSDNPIERELLDKLYHFCEVVHNSSDPNVASIKQFLFEDTHLQWDLTKLAASDGSDYDYKKCAEAFNKAKEEQPDLFKKFLDDVYYHKYE